MTFRRWFAFPFFPVLISAYPVMALFSANFTQVSASMLWRPLSLAMLGGILLLLATKALLRTWPRAAFVSMLLMVWFSSYGHIENYIIAQSVKFPASFLPAVWTILLALVLWAAVKVKFSDPSLVAMFNVIAVVLFAIPGVEAISYTVYTINFMRPNAQVSASPAVTAAEKPDVYYIILDSYSRADVLQKAFNYDNSDFVNSLEQMGFYVAPCSQSNYARTDFSLASSLNMSYVPDLDTAFTPDFRDPYPIWKLLKYSAVRSTLESAGYKTIAFATGFSWSQLEDADVYLRPPGALVHMTEFEALLLQTTLVRAGQDAGRLNFHRAAGEQFRQRTLFALDELAQMGKMPGPKFVFAHLIIPHPPFVFGASGEEIDPADYLSPKGIYSAKNYARGYLQAITYINKEIRRVLQQIINESSAPPVIIVQGDHGAWTLANPDRMQNLNAYYMPGHSDALYPSISPVNSFRVVFDSYLGKDYPLLEDKSYSAPMYELYKFSPVDYTCKK